MTRALEFLLAVSLVLSCPTSGWAQTSPAAKGSPTKLTPQEWTIPSEDGLSDSIYRGQLIEPLTPSPSADGKYPLIVFLHGAGERGDDNRAQLTHFPEIAMGFEFQQRHPSFLLAMQCPAHELWSPIDIEGVQKRGEVPKFDPKPTRAMQAVLQAIDKILATKPIDLTRVYLTGLSMGGFGSFDLAVRRPDLFAAVVPICGGGDPTTASKVASIPFYIVHGDDDPIVPVALSRAMCEAIAGASADLARAQRPKPDAANPRPVPKRKPNPMSREYAKVGHASWVPAYTFGEDGVLDWMFAQHKSQTPTEADTKSAPTGGTAQK